MGTWGHQFDENDQVGDWLDDLAAAPGWAKVAAALRQVVEQPLDHPEFDNGGVAIAAAEVVAAGLGRGNDRLKPEVAAWASADPAGAAALRQQAQASVAFVRDDSELRGLWDDTEEADAWLATVDDLASRLQ